MKRLTFGISLLALLLVPSPGFTQETASPKAAPAPKPKMKFQMIVAIPDDLKYGPLGAEFVSGKPSVETTGTLEVAVVAGDPTKPGPFTVYGRCSDGYKFAPHWHPTTENVTVLQGGIGIGMGSRWDSDTLKSVPTSGFFSVPERVRHFAQCNGETLVEIAGNGPFKINFVSAPAARKAPAKKAAAKKTPAKNAEEK